MPPSTASSTDLSAVLMVPNLLLFTLPSFETELGTIVEWLLCWMVVVSFAQTSPITFKARGLTLASMQGLCLLQLPTS